MDEIVELVDALHELRVQKGEIESRIAEVQEQIAAHLAESGAKTVEGSHVKVTVSTRRSWSWPKAGSAGRAALEDALRELGLYERAVAFSVGAAGKLLEDEEIDEAARERIGEFAERRETSSLRVTAR